MCVNQPTVTQHSHLKESHSVMRCCNKMEIKYINIGKNKPHHYAVSEFQNGSVIKVKTSFWRSGYDSHSDL